MGKGKEDTPTITQVAKQEIEPVSLVIDQCPVDCEL